MYSFQFHGITNGSTWETSWKSGAKSAWFQIENTKIYIQCLSTNFNIRSIQKSFDFRMKFDKNFNDEMIHRNGLSFDKQANLLFCTKIYLFFVHRHFVNSKIAIVSQQKCPVSNCDTISSDIFYAWEQIFWVFDPW